MSDADKVLALQEIDLALDQIPHRSGRLDERAAHASVSASLAAAKRAVSDAQSVIDTSASRIEQLEAEEHERVTKRGRLEQQMKTVISSRAADALTAELRMLDEERSVADDEELELMELVESETAKRDSALADVERLTGETGLAAAALADAESRLAEEREALQAQRAAAVAEIPAGMMDRYERMRKDFGGQAISRATGGHCGACHLDLSRAFLDDLHHLPEGEFGECEQCGRLLLP